MTMNLYYVEGISRIDTPSFNTKTHTGTITDQEEFFSTKLVKSIDKTFYPPYYHNTIKFDEDDLDITDNVNYLSIVFNGKTYYYFIDKIDYTSTGVITLEISMDVIQTFMFDIYISSGIIERKFINRWDGSLINRNYKRENLSDGLYVFELRSRINYDFNEWFIFAKYLDGSSIVRSKVGINEEVVYTPMEMYFFPYIQDKSFIAGGISLKADTLYFIGKQTSNPHCCSIFVIPFNPFSKSDYDADTNTFGPNIIPEFSPTHNPTDLYDCHGLGPKYSVKTNYHKSSGDLNSNIKHFTYNFDFVKNNQKSVLFSSRYMPVLFDENYLQFIFGSRSSNTTVSLFKYRVSSLICCYYANIIEGSRYYYISSDILGIDYNEDKFKSLVSDFAPISLDLISDTYAQFNETNKYRWLEAVGTTATRAVMSFVSVYARAAFAAKDIAKIASTSLTPVRKQLSKKGQRAIESIQRQRRDASIHEATDAIESFAPVTKQVIQDSNMMYAPDNIKQCNSMNDIASKSCEIFYEIQKVNDYEQCAQYYHHNGYLVNEYITQISNIFLSVRNRYYFDMLKMSIPEVHLHNVIEDEETVGLIEERFETGLRLWNVKNNDVVMGDFTYDNVELDYLS